MSNGSNRSYTDDIAARGLQAILDRRSQQRYGRTAQDQALASYMQGDPFVGQQSPMYDAYRQSMRPQGYQQSFGRGDGKYNGWDTQGLMTTELRGQAEMLREQDRMRAQALQSMIEDRLSGFEDRYLDNLNDLSGTYQVQNTAAPGWQAGRAATAGKAPVYDRVDDEMGSGIAAALKNRVHADQAQGAEIIGEDDPRVLYNKALGDWLDRASDPWLDAGDFASQVEQTPLRDYAFQAGAQLGIDPALVAGWYPESSQIGDFTQQRDLESIDMAGMPYSEYQRALQQMQSDSEQAYSDQDAAWQEQASNDIFNQYGIDGRQLASSAQMTLDQLMSAVNSDNFLTLEQEVSAALSSGGLDEDTLNEIVAAANGDPATQRALLAIYTPYLSGD